MFFWYLVCLEAADTPHLPLFFSLRGNLFASTATLTGSGRRDNEGDTFAKALIPRALEPIAESVAPDSSNSGNSCTSIASSSNNNTITTSRDARGQLLYSVPVDLDPAPNVVNLTSKMEEMRQLIQELNEDSTDTAELNVDK